MLNNKYVWAAALFVVALLTRGLTDAFEVSTVFLTLPQHALSVVAAVALMSLLLGRELSTAASGLRAGVAERLGRMRSGAGTGAKAE